METITLSESTELPKKNIKYYPSIQHFEPTILKPNGTDCYIEEKIDGSQLAFFLESEQIVFMNKNKVMAPNCSVYDRAMITLPIIKDKLNPNFIYYGEYVKSPKANVVIYKRIPKYYFILYDIYSMNEKKWFGCVEKKIEAERVGLECVPVLYIGDGTDIYQICENLINKIENGKIQSCLGGIPEGIVVKRAGAKFKMVSTAFKERHSKKQQKHIWKINDFLKSLAEQFNVGPRFQKAYQHLSEDEKELTLENFMNELDNDLYKEYRNEINSYIMAQCMEYIKRGFISNNEANKIHPDSIAQEIIDIARQYKESFSSNENNITDNLEKQILEILNVKFKPTICKYARSNLSAWYLEHIKSE
jgi:hypothetical protein